MALIDFGMKARRERDELRTAYEIECEASEAYGKAALKRGQALDEIASSTAKHASAVRLANIARKALGRPVGGGEQ